MKKVRMILSVAAILFAIVAAFATNSSPKSLADHKVDFLQATGCNIDGICRDSTSESVCEAPEGETLQSYSPTGPTCSAFAPVGKVWVD